MSSPALTNVEESTTPPPAPRFLTARFCAAMLLQSALILAVPLQSFMTYQRGQTVTLQTAPVDPYDLIRGYSQTLRYDISSKENLVSLPGGASVLIEERDVDKWIYITLQAPEGEEGAVPNAWEPVAVSGDRPESLSQNQVALKGRYTGRQIEYGLETYYMPESQRNDINEQIGDLQRLEARAFVVDVKVDSKGNSVPVSLWLGDRRYQF